MKSQLRFEVITEKQAAEDFWNLFSPHERIDDEWLFRYTFVKALDFPFHFIVGFDQEKPVGLLPLQLNTQKGLGPKLLGYDKPFLEFFGGVDGDDNRVFILPEYLDQASTFIDQIKGPAILTSLKDPNISTNKESEYYLDRFELDLTPFADYKGWIDQNFSGKSRKRIVNRVNSFNRDYKVEVKKSSFADLDMLFKLSIERFGGKSSFNMEYRRQIFRDLLADFNVDLFVLYLDDQPKAISFAIVFKTYYISLNLGYDNTITDISKFLVVTRIQRAKEFGCKLYDVGQGENGWKEQMHFVKIPQYKLEINL